MHLTSDSKFKEFTYGLTTPVRVLQVLLENPRLLGLFLLPMGITVLFIAITIYSLLIGLWSTSRDLLQHFLGSWTFLGSGVISFIGGVLFFYLLSLILNLLVQLVSSPFNDILAEKTEIACGQTPDPVTLRRLLQVAWIDLKKTGFSLTATLILLLIGLIPGLGIASLPGLALVQAFIFLSYPLSRRTLGLRASLGWIGGSFFRALGFGLITLVLFAIPVLNLFALPLSVMGGTLCYLKK